MVALTIGVTQNSSASTEYAFGVRFRRVVLELRVLAEERQLHIAGGAIALLRDDDVCDALARGVRVIDLFAIDQQNDVSILFNRARFTQIRHHRLLLDALLDAAVELRERDDRHL